MADSLDCVVKDNNLIVTLTGFQNYINAIYSSEIIKFNNVTYWDGAITTSDNPINSDNESGQNITLEIYNNKSQIVKKLNLVTNKTGHAAYDLSNLETGNYTFKAMHFEDNYYANYVTDEGSFNFTKVIHYTSAVKINITDGEEFYCNNCNISFNITNRTNVSVIITNANSSDVLLDINTDLDYIVVNLPPSDENYVIFIYNLGNETVDSSSDYKSFKILKINSTVNINPISNIEYGKNISVSFNGDGTLYNVVVYNETKSIVFNEIINKTSFDISNLNAGEYNVTVINLGSVNKSQSKSSIKFNVTKVNNNFKVEVTDAVYGKDITITVTADADGDYNVDINGTDYSVYVENGKGSKTVDNFNVGNYTAKVSFENKNYNNNATNTTFKIKKAQSHVIIVDFDNVTWNYTKNIRFSDFYPAEYNVTIFDSEKNIKHSEITNSLLYTIPILDAGEYNLTVTNLGNNNVIGSQNSIMFSVIKDNNVQVFAENTYYNRELFISLDAEVNGSYTVDIKVHKYLLK